MDLVPKAAATGYRVKGWHVAAAVTAFFAIIVAVEVSFAVIAYRTHPGQVSVTPYEDGLLYDRHIAQRRTQDRLGWTATVEARQGTLVLTYADNGGRPLEGLVVTATLERPATRTGRFSPSFKETAAGQYEASVNGLRGTWDVTAEARAGPNVTFVAERRIAWP